jgi:hypothetical protein|nr:hypothetical protein [uncultured Peptostreptococcus sp.]
MKKANDINKINKINEKLNKKLVDEGDILCILAGVAGSLESITQTGIPIMLLMAQGGDDTGLVRKAVDFTKKSLKECIELLDAIKYEESEGQKTSKINELNLDFEDVKDRSTIEVEEFNRNIELLTSVTKYFKSIGAFCVTLWTDSKPEIDIQVDDNSVISEYLNKNEKLTIRDIGGFDRYGIKKGDLDIHYLKSKKSRLK